MKYEETPIKDCYLITPDLYKDERGLFFESFVDSKYFHIFGSVDFGQDNVSISKKNVLRGLHYQKDIYSQAKLVKVLKGRVQDVIVDCREYSPSYGVIYSKILDAKEYQQLFIPRGCAHGFLTMEDDTIFCYKVDNIYEKNAETGIIYNDPDLKIKWFFKKDDLLTISGKDTSLPRWKHCYKFKEDI
jgi:dTDP-4-dehydrorhamnose 3,5-epimerase